MLKLHLSDKSQTASTEGIQASRCISATVKQSFQRVPLPSPSSFPPRSKAQAGLEANLFKTSTAGNICPAYR